MNRIRGRLRAKHGPEGCSGADGATFATAADLCWVCWWNALLGIREYPVTNDRPREHELNLMNERTKAQ